MHEVYNTDLVNTLGNSLSRTSAMINKYYDGGVVPGEVSVTTGNTVTFDGYDWPATCRETKSEVERAIGAMELLDEEATQLSTQNELHQRLLSVGREVGVRAT